MKRDLQSVYIENSKMDIRMFIGEIANKFQNKSFQNLFKKCGYLQTGKFDPSNGYNMDLQALGYVDQID